MGAEEQKARDELLYDLIKGERNLALGLAIVYGACVVAAAVFLVFIVLMHKGLGAFVYDIGLGVGFMPMSAYWFSRYKDVCTALEEIGPDYTGVDTCRTYSAKTADVISGSRKTESELRQLWIAYGILGLVMLGMGVLMGALLLGSFSSGEGVLVFTGVIMLVGGIILTSMAIKAFREWTITLRIESMEE